MSKKTVMQTMQEHIQNTYKYFNYQEQSLKIEYLKRSLDIADGIKLLANRLYVNEEEGFTRLYLDFVFAITEKIEKMKETKNHEQHYRSNETTNKRGEARGT